ncbi:unnamed protein product [marine sediment metagenome]|uniref:Flavoprotein domain-containing protein n=1 Tax=marine sediment metagenome TaxID=412755 RepID=X1HNC9_9ZZZZ
MFKLIWGITGTGYILQELIDLMVDLQNNHDIDITVILSKDAYHVFKSVREMQ